MIRRAQAAHHGTTSTDFENQVWILKPGPAYVRRRLGSPPTRNGTARSSGMQIPGVS